MSETLWKAGYTLTATDVDAIRGTVTRLYDKEEDLTQRLAASEARVRKLEEALTWYADPEKYRGAVIIKTVDPESGPIWLGTIDKAEEYSKDEGQRARDALTGTQADHTPGVDKHASALEAVVQAARTVITADWGNEQVDAENALGDALEKLDELKGLK